MDEEQEATGAGFGRPSAFDDLVDAVAARRAVLFAGAGLSMAVGLPSWRELIEHMSRELLRNGEQDLGPDVTYQTLAEYYRLRQGSIGPLRSWMDRSWSVSEDTVRRSRVHELVVALDFLIIYTTNYDSNLEVAFRLHGREFIKVTNARDLARLRDDVPQIVKFHGDFDDDQSLVLAESDYLDRLAFDSPLDIKFRADALGRTILFVGYSMSDLNIRLLLYRLWQTWHRSGAERDRPRSFVFMPRPNPIQAAVLGQWGIDLLSGDSDDPEAALVGFLDEIHQRVRDLAAQRERGAADPAPIDNSAGRK